MNLKNGREKDIPSAGLSHNVLAGTSFSRPTAPQSSRGITTLLVIAFMGIFLLVMGTVTSYAFEEAKYGRALLGREQALHVAEAGLEYYRWYLAHNPGNLTNGTGVAGPYSYTVNDPETGTSIGTAAISVTGNTQCGQIQSIDIISKGTATANPGFPRTLSARYMQTSMAWYSSVLNNSVWPLGNITGPYFSNGGIHMDDLVTNNSDVLSPLTSWDCTNSYGCTPEQATAPGVVGTGTGPTPGAVLWKWGTGVSSIDFNGISNAFTNLRTYAKNNGGLYFPTVGGGAMLPQYGYHLIFNSNGTVTVKQVLSTIGVPSYSATHGWSYVNYAPIPPEYSIINTETSGTTYAIPSTCALIFVEDRAWIEGVVKGKVTVVAATPSDSGTKPDIYLPNNITYATNDGTTGLTAIAEGGVLVTLKTPDNMVLHGIFVAAGGAFERPWYSSNYYGCPYYDVNCVDSSYAQYSTRTTLTTDGTIISYARPGTYWLSPNSNNFNNGYLNRVTAYDELQATNPPPFTPAASTNYSFVLWKEQ